MASLSEGLALAASLELPAEALLQAVDISAISNPLFRLKGPLVLQDSYVANFPLKHAQKDMRLALELAQEQGLSLSAALAANELYVKALHAGFGDEDFSAVRKAVSK